MNPDRRTQRNLRLVPLYQALAYGYAVIPFLLFLVEARGLSLAEYASLQSVYYATGLLLEVPTGVFADRYGRRPALLAGAALQIVAFATIALARDYGAFAASHVLLGAGQSFISGTTAAILYDSLQAVGREAECLQFEAKSVIARLGGTSLAFLAGGFLSQFVSMESSAWASAGFSVLALPVAWFLVEPPRRDPATHGRPLLGLVTGSLVAIARDASLRWIAVAFTVLFVALRIAFYFYTPNFDRAGITSHAAIGCIYCALNVVAAISTRWSARVGARMDERTLILILLGTLALSFAVQSIETNLAVVVVTAVLQQIPFGVHFPVVTSCVNRRVGDEHRATLLSCLSLFGRASFALIFPAIGLLASVSVGRAMFASSVSLLGVAILLYLFRPRAASGAHDASLSAGRPPREP
jgi:MFS family permease